MNVKNYYEEKRKREADFRHRENLRKAEFLIQSVMVTTPDGEELQAYIPVLRDGQEVWIENPRLKELCGE